LGGLGIAPELAGVRAQMVPGGVARRMVGHRRGEFHLEPSRLRTTLNLITPVGVDLAGQIHRKTHRLMLLHDDPTGPTGILRHPAGGSEERYALRQGTRWGEEARRSGRIRISRPFALSKRAPP